MKNQRGRNEILIMSGNPSEAKLETFLNEICDEYVSVVKWNPDDNEYVLDADIPFCELMLCKLCIILRASASDTQQEYVKCLTKKLYDVCGTRLLNSCSLPDYDNLSPRYQCLTI